MQEFLARKNIDLFRKLLAEKPEAATRALLERMLIEEQQKLRACRRPAAVASQDRVNDGVRSPAAVDLSGG